MVCRGCMLVVDPVDMYYFILSYVSEKYNIKIITDQIK